MFKRMLKVLVHEVSDIQSARESRLYSKGPPSENVIALNRTLNALNLHKLASSTAPPNPQCPQCKMYSQYSLLQGQSTMLAQIPSMAVFHPSSINMKGSLSAIELTTVQSSHTSSGNNVIQENCNKDGSQLSYETTGKVCGKKEDSTKTKLKQYHTEGSCALPPCSGCDRCCRAADGVCPYCGSVYPYWTNACVRAPAQHQFPLPQCEASSQPLASLKYSVKDHGPQATLQCEKPLQSVHFGPKGELPVDFTPSVLSCTTPPPPRTPPPPCCHMCPRVCDIMAPCYFTPCPIEKNPQCPSPGSCCPPLPTPKYPQLPLMCPPCPPPSSPCPPPCPPPKPCPPLCYPCSSRPCPPSPPPPKCLPPPCPCPTCKPCSPLCYPCPPPPPCPPPCPPSPPICPPPCPPRCPPPCPPPCRPCRPCRPCPPCPPYPPCPCPPPCPPPICDPCAPIPPNPCCPRFFKGDFKKYKYIFLAMVPIIILHTIYSLCSSHGHKEPCREYEYMRRRTKRFPWGSGDETLFHNDKVNNLPGECGPPDEC